MKQKKEHFQDAIWSVAIKQCANICCHFPFPCADLVERWGSWWAPHHQCFTPMIFYTGKLLTAYRITALGIFLLGL